MMHSTEEIIALVNEEEELSGPMPDSLWKDIQLAVMKGQKEVVEHFLRSIVVETKKGIIERLQKREQP